MIDLEAFRERSMQVAGMSGAAGGIPNPVERARVLDQLNDQLLEIIEGLYEAIEEEQENSPIQPNSGPIISGPG